MLTLAAIFWPGLSLPLGEEAAFLMNQEVGGGLT